MTNIVYINPDDTELKNAVNRAAECKKAFEQADKDWNREEPSMYIFTQQYEAMSKARDKYDGALMTVGKLIMERL